MAVWWQDDWVGDRNCRLKAEDGVLTDCISWLRTHGPGLGDVGVTNNVNVNSWLQMVFCKWCADGERLHDQNHYTCMRRWPAGTF